MSKEIGSDSTAATVSGASNAKAVGNWLHNLPNRVVKAMAACMTDMERNFAARGVFACIEARIERPHDITAVFDWSFQNRWESDDREPQHPAPAYARTLGSQSFRRKIEVILGQDIAMEVISVYDDAISARRLRSRVAAACREHGAALPESAEDMAAVVENHPYFTSFGLRRIPKYRKMDKYELRFLPPGLQRAANPRSVEGPTEVDAVFEGSEFLVFVEAKLGSDISEQTTYDPLRNQIEQNIDCAIEEAGDRQPLFWMFVKERQTQFTHSKIIETYRSDVGVLQSRLPHRNSGVLARIVKGIAVVEWRELVSLIPVTPGLLLMLAHTYARA